MHASQLTPSWRLQVAGRCTWPDGCECYQFGGFSGGAERCRCHHFKDEHEALEAPEASGL